MKFVIAGGTGFIGDHLSNKLLEQGHDVTILTRYPPKGKSGTMKYVKWLGKGDKPEKEMEDIDCLINLAGRSLNQGRWNEKGKAEILDSRIHSVEELIRIVSKLKTKPKVFINASAIGIYPPSEHAVYTERSENRAEDFLGTVVKKWEEKAKRLNDLQIRTVLARFGVVLAKDGGAYPLLKIPYRLFFGGKIGSGKQWMSWIHIDDVIRALLFIVENEQIKGPVNITAPNPVRMDKFGKTIARVLKRPHWFSVPSNLVKMVLREKSTLVLEGQYVLPETLTTNGFSFLYPNLYSALQHLENIG
ncbi:TIGR01777 family oxidoreductase [Fervidibacillus halotolerans]|uniref:TIGR01777 family oxidoreductase n=1 Tax=Fervidibacillus halotolerans TaxID=2980027 RepID=A0A9E8M1C9_9BACI|nr:TIGR01777 family oxidoreductase [Fervidibacillus halotolerans]WAA13444.1 TIGR01777 family oxidoreductase [Fervidibacillus halotolerans]